MNSPKDFQGAGRESDEYLKQRKSLYWQRVSNFPLTLFVSVGLVSVFIWLVYMTTQVPDEQPLASFRQLGEAFLWWQEDQAELRDSLRDGLLEVTAGLLAFLGLMSLAQVPGIDSDIEQHVRHRISQHVAIAAAIGLAAYALLSLPLTTPEKDSFKAWQGVLVVIMASAISMLIGPDKSQRLANLSHLTYRVNRIHQRQREVEEHFRDSRAKNHQQLNLLGWLTKEWREVVQSSGFDQGFGTKPPLSRRKAPFLLPVAPVLAPAIIWALWALTQEWLLGPERGYSWMMPVALATCLTIAASASTAFYYVQAWDAAIGSKWQIVPTLVSDLLVVLLLLLIALGASRGSAMYLTGNIACVLLAVGWSLKGRRSRPIKILELERRSLLSKEQRTLMRHENLNDLERARMA